MGLTNSVQPYCRLAIITMQTMPKTSCHHLDANEEALTLRNACTVVIPIPVLFSSPIPSPADGVSDSASQLCCVLCGGGMLQRNIACAIPCAIQLGNRKTPTPRS